MLLLSVFFGQHVLTLNYNLVAALGLVVTFYSIQKGNDAGAVAGLIVCGLKPSIAIPALLYVIVTKRVKVLGWTLLWYIAALAIASAWLGANPFKLLLQLEHAQATYSNGFTDGVLYLLRPILGGEVATFGFVACVATLWLSRRHIYDPISGLAVVSALGIGLFYNHVHAWIIAYPLLIVAVTDYRTRGASIFPILGLVAFLLIPRLAGIVSGRWIDVYMAVHNLMRFGSCSGRLSQSFGSGALILTCLEFRADGSSTAFNVPPGVKGIAYSSRDRSGREVRLGFIRPGPPDGNRFHRLKTGGKTTTNTASTARSEISPRSSSHAR